MSLTNTGETQMLTLFKGKGTFYLALYTTDPGEAGTATGEVSGGAYARQAVTFAAPSGNSMKNSAVIEFPTATASWGTVAYWGLVDAATNGSIWWTGAITTPKEITTGDIYRIPVSSLTLTID